MNVSPFNTSANFNANDSENGPSRSQSSLPSYNTDTYAISYKINNGVPLGTKFQRRIIPQPPWTPSSSSPLHPHSTDQSPSPLHPDSTMTPAPHHHHHRPHHSSTPSALQLHQQHHRWHLKHADAPAAVTRSGLNQLPREPRSARDYGCWYSGRTHVPRGPGGSVVRSHPQQYSPPQQQQQSGSQRSANAELNIRGTSAGAAVLRGHDVGVSAGAAARGRGSNVWVAPAVLAAQQQRRQQAVSGHNELPRRDADGHGNTARTGPGIDASRELRARRRAAAPTTTTTTSTQTQTPRPRPTTSGTQTSPQPLAQPLARPRPASPTPPLHRQPYPPAPYSPYPHYQAPTYLPSITREIATREEAARVHARRGEREKWLRNRDALAWLRARAGALREEEEEEEEGQESRGRAERGTQERRGETEAIEEGAGEGGDDEGEEDEWEEIRTPSSSSSAGSGSGAGYEQLSRDGNARGDAVGQADDYKAGTAIVAANANTNANARREQQRRHSEADPYMYGDAASDVEDLLDYGWGLERGDRGGRA